MPQPTSSVTFSRREKARLRLASQGLTMPRWESAEEVVRAFGVMQGQDLYTVRRSLALRAKDHSDAGNMVRGYPMRNTLFAASIKDIGWITELCAKGRKGEAELRAEVNKLIENPLSRAELKERAVTALPDVPFWHVVRVAMESGHAVYSGADQLITPVDLPGLEETFNGDKVAATAELMTRYFRTHGPATLRDFAWWAKLSQKLIRPAAENLAPDIVRCGEESQDLFSAEIVEIAEARKKQSVLLLGAFDEYILGYQDRLFAMTNEVHEALVPGNRGVFRRAIVVDGQVRGTWNKQDIEDLGMPGYAMRKVQKLWRDAH
ncbi:DNA glycosylase AlkZ-like family protein [Corynebacterium tuberculostearicum]|uniref:DNA glycosylase AlkZ-like family protein n=1 Tax=Corynebacterium tuberculostearicum TaxID=38304 RepID=UPI002647E957|nr:crosslink repair DNA glycosylase YcaQ family protein [Corynebacterium tuberculostearicum]MDV2432032.1 crosslink repair DNA glycosylase YcaQ family protein [Corynebacterium tuberculostearicum]WKE59562.1 winged helix DNA-binding domain-containing protein [Corynebacterium tuberculostearicum]